DEKIEILDSQKLEIEISNIGATLDKVKIKEYDTSLPLSGITGISGYENVPYELSQGGNGDIQYIYENDDIKIVKTYAVKEGDYIIKSGITVYNKSDMSKQVKMDIKSYSIEMSSLDKKNEKIDKIAARDKSLNEYIINLENRVHRKAGAFKFSAKEKKEELGQVLWSGFRNRYFCLLIKPQYETQGYSVDPVTDNSLDLKIGAKEVMIPSQGNVQFDSIIYAGPEKIEVLKSYGLGFEKVRKYYRFALFDGIAKIIASLMRTLHKVIPSWGICIMLISVIIYFSMYPLTMRGMLSMKKMQSLQPMIVKLKEKHKDSPQKMNKEMMELYKEHKVNPLGGCLPMLLQMPVFIGLYQVLWRSVSFKGAPFLWIKDLSQPDRLFIFPFSFPIMGNELNLLPLVMVVVMFFQQKLTAKNMVVTDPSQAAQQKMMATIMPIFLGFIFYKFASGLTLYFTMFYFFSTFTQWKMSKSAKVG
ncbi:MAG: YidC/Oxa1 family insertase periplasmic-domain containing protein, partial [Candidatus Omnitrophica bacterium]|nr:YidC/Oxa1 family insertase periplasmic-domain containing protein [Candidatus Omnitrophota bacterium]